MNGLYQFDIGRRSRMLIELMFMSRVYGREVPCGKHMTKRIKEAGNQVNVSG